MNVRSGFRFFLGLGLACLLVGCQQTMWCCPPGSKRPPTSAACRTGCVCLWPPEGGRLEPGDTPLTPAANAFFNCPRLRDPYPYTRLPFECEDHPDRAGFR